MRPAQERLDSLPPVGGPLLGRLALQHGLDDGAINDGDVLELAGLGDNDNVIAKGDQLASKVLWTVPVDHARFDCFVGVAAKVMEVPSRVSKSIGLYLPESLVSRSDSNGDDIEGYAGAGLYDSVPLHLPEPTRVDSSNDPAMTQRIGRACTWCRRGPRRTREGGTGERMWAVKVSLMPVKVYVKVSLRLISTP